MGSRGRGRGRASMSITNEQLGFGKGEALPPPVLQPPSKYPTLDYKPIPFELNTELSYLLEIKRDFAEFLRESSYSVQSIIVKRDIERYSDRYQEMVNDKIAYDKRYNWTRMPVELRPAIRKRKIGMDKRTNDSLTKKTKGEIDVAKKLQELEQKESSQQSDVDEDDKGEEEEEEKDAEDPPEEEEEEVDEEMDDGTDYVNNYFDNGEGYDDDDDNLDDGPIY